MSTSVAGMENSLIQGGLLLTATCASILANGFYVGLIHSLLGPYGSTVIGILGIVAALGAFFKALQSTPLSIPSSASQTVTVDSGTTVNKSVPLSAADVAKPVTSSVSIKAPVAPVFVNPQQAELDKEFPKAEDAQKPSMSDLNNTLSQLAAATEMAQPGSKNVYIKLTPSAKPK